MTAEFGLIGHPTASFVLRLSDHAQQGLFENYSTTIIYILYELLQMEAYYLNLHWVISIIAYFGANQK